MLDKTIWKKYQKAKRRHIRAQMREVERKRRMAKTLASAFGQMLAKSPLFNPSLKTGFEEIFPTPEIVNVLKEDLKVQLDCYGKTFARNKQECIDCPINGDCRMEHWVRTGKMIK